MMGVVYRLYPSDSQEVLINQAFGCCRKVWNYFLDGRIFMYDQLGITYGYVECCRVLSEYKTHYTYLRDVDSTALQREVKYLDEAFKAFFDKRGGFPRYKSKNDDKKSYTSVNNGNTIRFNGDEIRLPKVGWVKAKNKLHPEGRILSATITREHTGNYYVSVVYTGVTVEMLPASENVIGLDVGIKNTVVMSDNTVFNQSPRIIKLQNHIIFLQKKLSRQKKDSNNYKKTKIKISKTYKRIHNIINDEYDKLSTRLIRENQVIVIESLNIEGMMKNHNLARQIQTKSWNSLFNKLQYKADRYGRTLIRIDAWYPSSKLCHNCHYENKELTLNDRTWACPKCKTVHDRDYNAALNIKEEGLRIYNENF